jgi:hypothetical protein
MRCRYSWVHLVLHGCLHSTDAALLDQQRAFLRYDLPSKLSDVWLCVSAAMDLDTPMVHTGKLIKVVLEAAKSCESDPRLLLSLADTAEAQDAPVNGLVASRWQRVRWSTSLRIVCSMKPGCCVETGSHGQQGQQMSPPSGSCLSLRDSR